MIFQCPGIVVMEFRVVNMPVTLMLAIVMFLRKEKGQTQSLINVSHNFFVKKKLKKASLKI